MQTAYINSHNVEIQLKMPPENEEVLPGVNWGPIYGFGSPAFWKFITLSRRLESRKINSKLGRTLMEETAACILGGHGIPADMGLAAYNHIHDKGAFNGTVPSKESLLNLLNEPINYRSKQARYRFAKQKSDYLHEAFCAISSSDVTNLSSIELRNWLLDIKGIGFKTASWIVRNWKQSDEVAILDIHILRAGWLARFFDPSLKVERNYLDLEKKFIEFAKALEIPTSELDAVIWHEMMSAPHIARSALRSKQSTLNH